MRKYLLVLFAVGVSAVTLRAQQLPRRENNTKGRNVVAVSGGFALAFGEGQTVGPFVYAEYARNVRGKFWVGGRLSFQDNWYAATCAPSYYMDGYFLTTLYGIAYWDFPVARRWLSLRVGGGMGAGLHATWAIMPPESPLEHPTVAPYFMVRIEWVVHITRNFGLTFAPLIAGPLGSSQLEFTPLAPYTVKGAASPLGKVDMFGHLGIYVRF